MGAGRRDLGSEDCTDPPICLGDDEIGARGGGEDAGEDDEEKRSGAAEGRRRSRHLPAADRVGELASRSRRDVKRSWL